MKDTNLTQENQVDGESADQYITELQTLAATCEFGDLKDSRIRDRIVVESIAKPSKKGF